MTSIKGQIKYIIYENNNYKVGKFKVKTADEELNQLVNKLITFTGYFLDTEIDDDYEFIGQYVNHDKYGYQFNVENYSKLKPTGREAVIDFLASKFIEGCGIKTAQKIVDTLGDDAINIIKQNPNSLNSIPNLSHKKAVSIYNSLMKYSAQNDLILDLEQMGFSLKETMLIINKYQENTRKVIEENIYQMIEIIEFNKLDRVYQKNFEPDNEIRCKACIVESLKRLEFYNGDTYHNKSDILQLLNKDFKIMILDIDYYLEKLLEEKVIYLINDEVCLRTTYELEKSIALNLSLIKKGYLKRLSNLDNDIKLLEDELNLKYSSLQKDAIKDALKNKICIITGGPGTGKTTLINAIVKLYIMKNKLNPYEISNDIALLAPTGRAAKKMSQSTSLPAQTIHRYLKWNKETDTFSIDENNKNSHKLVIVDETSMIDTNLFAALLNGIYASAILILVGDENQLPSVGAGLILNDLIRSQKFKHVKLDKIFRQSQNSYIPFLAKEINEAKISEDFFKQSDDYNFIEANSKDIKKIIRKICLMSKQKYLTQKDVQILAPLYKGTNGIDNLNKLLQDLYNPTDENKKIIKVGDIIYQEDDKVLQLVNDPDNNVFNGDIGYIHKIKKDEHNKDVVIIDFDGNYVEYKRDDMNNLKHAYAMSIHKSQGSEFNHVILPICMDYTKMLYNKLIYTAVSRAKVSLVIIGDKQAFISAVLNPYSNLRKTNLVKQLTEYID